jgi:hypothetical protein
MYGVLACGWHCSYWCDGFRSPQARFRYRSRQPYTGVFRSTFRAVLHDTSSRTVCGVQYLFPARIMNAIAPALPCCTTRSGALASEGMRHGRTALAGSGMRWASTKPAPIRHVMKLGCSPIPSPACPSVALTGRSLPVIQRNPASSGCTNSGTGSRRVLSSRSPAMGTLPARRPVPDRGC